MRKVYKFIKKSLLMFITITAIKLRSVWNFFHLSWLGFLSMQQLKGEKGFRKFKNTGFGYWHYTMTSWDSEEDLKRYAKTGNHLEVMKKSSIIASEFRTYTYQGEMMPNWKEAKELVAVNGRGLKFEKKIPA
jgi:hypothetical protein